MEPKVYELRVDIVMEKRRRFILSLTTSWFSVYDADLT